MVDVVGPQFVNKRSPADNLTTIAQFLPVFLLTVGPLGVSFTKEVKRQPPDNRQTIARPSTSHKNPKWFVDRNKYHWSVIFFSQPNASK